jgi:hypothetical protein
MSTQIIPLKDRTDLRESSRILATSRPRSDKHFLVAEASDHGT